MEQSELGKTEEDINTSEAAELPENEQEPVSAETGNGATEQDVTEVDAQPEASVESDEDDGTDSDVEPAQATSTEEVDEDDAPASSDDVASNGLKRGDIVQGTVSRTTPMAVYVKLANDVEGRVPARELELMTRNVLESLQEGAEVTVFVVNPLNHKGDTILSINQAQEEIDWREAEEYLENKEVYDGRIGGYNKGGLIVRFGQLRGFVPQSQISDTRLRAMSGDTPEERYGGMVNENIGVKVMEVDRSRNRLILSERAAMREVRQRRKEALITELQVGEERDGTVVSLENFGAFVDVGGAEGLVHLTEISWEHVTHPRQALNVGEDVRVKVISVDADNNRIGLSIKSLLADPWDEIAAVYPVGALVRGQITKLARFGAFAKVLGSPSVEGLIHISEMSDNRVEHPRDVVKRGDDLTLRVVKVDIKERRLGLSIKRVNSEEYLDQDLEQAYKEAASAPVPAKPAPAAPVAEAVAPEAPEPEAQVIEEPVVEELTAEAEPETLVEKIEDAVEDVVEKAKGVLEDVVEAIKDAAEDVVEKAEDMVESVTHSAEAAAEDVAEAVDADDTDESDADEDD
ncbi:MAG: S1 RNA-binding domain-containing protein [Anaerolineae bacterium]|nr:S1 RNA-binding domain-containing protein [Anaerolineae bacterium]